MSAAACYAHPAQEESPWAAPVVKPGAPGGGSSVSLMRFVISAVSKLSHSFHNAVTVLPIHDELCLFYPPCK